MKKLINDPNRYVDEMLHGMVAYNPEFTLQGEDRRVVARAERGSTPRVGVVSGGGSGHIPLFAGYVGLGLLDACAVGNVFEGPTSAACMDAIAVANQGEGVLLLYGNYGGDRMNFDMAAEAVGIDGIRCETVLGTDDVASAGADNIASRRGVAGLIYAYKIAGALAANQASLQEVAAVAQRTVDRTRTIGLALGPCIIPGNSEPSFELGEHEVEMGTGIHGEPGIWRAEMRRADALVDKMLQRLLAEAPEGAGRVSILVNGLGATPYEELFIAYRRVSERLHEAGYQIVQPLVGPYATSMEMAGISISILFLDEEIERLLKAPAFCPFWRVS